MHAWIIIFQPYILSPSVHCQTVKVIYSSSVLPSLQLDLSLLQCLLQNCQFQPPQPSFPWMHLHLCNPSCANTCRKTFHVLEKIQMMLQVKWGGEPLTRMHICELENMKNITYLFTDLETLTGVRSVGCSGPNTPELHQRPASLPFRPC